MNPAEYFKASFVASFSRESVEFSVDSLKDMHGNVSWEESQELVWNPEKFYQRILILFFCFALIFFFFFFLDFSLWKTLPRQKQKASIMNLHVAVTQLP